MGVLDNKVAIITGAARGMGEETAKLFAESGARVVLTDLNETAVQGLAKSLGKNAVGLKHDVSNEGGWAQAVEAARSTFGGIHVLVNNAGIFFEGAMGVATAA